MKTQTWKSSIKRFLTAQTISLFGSSLVQYAIIWHITLSTSSGKMLTISTLCGFLPQILISLFAGVLIDRYDRKKMIMLSDSLIAISTLILALSFLFEQNNTWILFAVLIVRSAGTGVQTPSVNAIIPQIVPQEHLMKIGGINSTVSSMMMFLSPAISGALLSVAPITIVLLIDVVTAIIGVSITATIKIKPYEKTHTAATSGILQIKEGFDYLKKNQFVRNLIIFQMIVLFLISPSAFLTPLMVSRTFGMEVWRLTASEMTYSLGMVFGGLIITTWGGFKNRINTTLLAGAAYGAVMIGLGIAPTFIIYLILNTTIGIASPCYNTPITVSIQEKVVPEMHGRIFSLMQIATSCALPLGMAFFGPLADFIQIQWLLMIAGGLVLIVSFLKWLSIKQNKSNL